MKRPARPLAALLLALTLGMLLTAPNAAALDEEPFTEGELAQMLAPVALYPDALLSQILMAATYPLEVVEAARWSRDNPVLEGRAAVDAVEDRDWDPSVKALVAFPRVLAQMNEDLSWTRNVGDAFLLQEEDVAAMIQELRHKAHEAGQLQRQEHIRVVRDREVIVIEPANPRVVYVPYYRPTVVYGGWWWPAYAPVYWHPPYGHTFSVGITWVSGVPVSHGFFFSTFNWHHRHVVVIRHYDRHRHVGSKARPGTYRWRHDPWHRRGVAYKHRSVQERFTGRHGQVTREAPRTGTGSRYSGRPTSPSWQPRGTRRGGDTSSRGTGPRTRSDRQSRGSPGPDTRRAWQNEGRDGARTGRGPATTDHTTPRRNAAPRLRDRSGPEQQTGTLRRELQDRRAWTERHGAGRTGETRPSRGAQRPDVAVRDGQHTERARGRPSDQIGRDARTWRSQRGDATHQGTPRAGGSRGAWQADGSHRPGRAEGRGSSRSQTWTRQGPRAGGGNRGEQRGGFSR
ncbi:DUF3300 domain-containing protein [Thioalkalivibrio thiocyanodenitrificans]|uniref:DUF3300 domain-containing protein n=1 Tax=Thioalkalivibrio thiocyanodenitrificans TaxID=243063 RepID=UPI00036A6C6E|nr:DUF3300 domain-containing protein [Thioalkalivibrio thiocyanodenitrificans]